MKNDHTFCITSGASGLRGEFIKDADISRCKRASIQDVDSNSVVHHESVVRHEHV